MQHAAWTFDTSDIPWILQNLLFSQTSFWWEDFFNISNHLPAHLHKWPIWPLILLTAVLDGRFTHFGGFFSIFTGHLALKFYWDKTCFFRHLQHYKLHWNYLISHAKTSFIVNCAGGTQGTQLLDWSNKGQVQAIRLRWVQVTWHPSLWCWSLWIG